MYYIGDDISVQLFRKDGICVQRLGEELPGKGMNQFQAVFSICVFEDQLYVSDAGNERIQIFRRARNNN